MESKAVSTRQVPGERCSQYGSCPAVWSETGKCGTLPAGEAAAETPPWSESGGHVSEARVVVQVVPFHRQQPFAAGLAWRGLPRWPPVRLGYPPLPAHH